MRVKNMNILFAMTVFGVWHVSSSPMPSYNYDEYFKPVKGLAGTEYQISEAQLKKLYQQDPKGVENYVEGKNIALCETEIETGTGDIYTEEYDFLSDFYGDECTNYNVLSGITIFEYMQDENNYKPYPKQNSYPKQNY